MLSESKKIENEVFSFFSRRRKFHIKKNHVLTRQSCLFILSDFYSDVFYLGLYKVEFRILEIRISRETNLKTHFLSGNWIQKKSFEAPPKREEWCVLCSFKQPNCQAAFH